MFGAESNELNSGEFFGNLLQIVLQSVSEGDNVIGANLSTDLDGKDGLFLSAGGKGGESYGVNVLVSDHGLL